MNPERVSLPDIDLDFPDHRREEVIEYVQRKYGRGHVAQILTFGTLAAKAAVRDVGKVLAFHSYTIEQVAREIPSAPGTTLAKAIRQSQRLKELIAESDEVRRLLKLAQAIEGLPRHASTHAAGVVIHQEKLTEIVALQSGHANIPLTQATMDVVELVGGVKFDFLGLRNLTLLERMLDFIEEHEGERLELSELPLDDRETFALLSKGDTTGVFQLESSGMRKVLKQLRPSEFEDIVAVNALYRPGPMDYISDYIKGKQEPESVQYLHQDLKPFFNENVRCDCLSGANYTNCR